MQRFYLRRQHSMASELSRYENEGPSCCPLLLLVHVGAPVSAAGALMVEAQREFDAKAAPVCPQHLMSPVLHRVLSHGSIQQHIYGGKGVGSQVAGEVNWLILRAAPSPCLHSVGFWLAAVCHIRNDALCSTGACDAGRWNGAADLPGTRGAARCVQHSRYGARRALHQADPAANEEQRIPKNSSYGIGACKRLSLSYIAATHGRQNEPGVPQIPMLFSFMYVLMPVQGVTSAVDISALEEQCRVLELRLAAAREQVAAAKSPQLTPSQNGLALT